MILETPNLTYFMAIKFRSSKVLGGFLADSYLRLIIFIFTKWNFSPTIQFIFICISSLLHVFEICSKCNNRCISAFRQGHKIFIECKRYIFAQIIDDILCRLFYFHILVIFGDIFDTILRIPLGYGDILKWFYKYDQNAEVHPSS